MTKVFRGDSNVTIESMVKLARATGGEIDIRIIDSASATGSEWAVASLRNRKAVPLRTASVSTIPAKAANHAVYAISQGATERELATA